MKKSDLPPDPETPKVGYRSPPKAHQFRNNGQIRFCSFAEAIILQNIKAALQKDSNAVANMFRLAEEADEFKDWSDPKVAGKPLFMPGKMSEEDFDVEYDCGIIHMPSRTSDSRED